MCPRPTSWAGSPTAARWKRPSAAPSSPARCHAASCSTARALLRTCAARAPPTRRRRARREPCGSAQRVRGASCASTVQGGEARRLSCGTGMMQRMEVAIRARNLRKTYEGKVEAVCGLDLEILAGECFGLLGPNGAGKTTTIEILEGLLEPTGGEVEVLGRRWDAHARELRELLGISLQETRLSEKLTVRETIELFASFYNRPRSADTVMEELSLTEKADAWVGKLSGGQKQRLAVATALVGNPKVLFLDEPTTGLDPQSRRQLWDIVRQFQKRGGTILLTTHYMDEAEKLCDRLAIIDHGKIIAEGSPAEL